MVLYDAIWQPGRTHELGTVTQPCTVVPHIRVSSTCTVEATKQKLRWSDARTVHATTFPAVHTNLLRYTTRPAQHPCFQNCLKLRASQSDQLLHNLLIDACHTWRAIQSYTLTHCTWPSLM
jgi:hypothetical protein